MRKENYLFVLWIIFGFVFIQAIDSILQFITYTFYIGLSAIGISFKNLTILIPILTFGTYLFATMLLVKRIKIKSDIDGIYFKDFHRNNFIIFIIIAIFLSPITYKLSGLYLEHSDAIQNSNNSDFISFYGWMTFGINTSKWLILIYLGFIYLNKYNRRKQEN